MTKDTKEKIDYTKELNYDQAVSYLEDLLDSFKSGKIVITHEDNTIALTPNENVSVEIKARTKKKKQKFVMSLSWKDGATQNDNFSIKSDEKAPTKAPDTDEKK